MRWLLWSVIRVYFGLQSRLIGIACHLEAHAFQNLWYDSCLTASILYGTSFGFQPCSTCLCKCWYEYLSLLSISLWLMYAAPHTQLTQHLSPHGRRCQQIDKNAKTSMIFLLCFCVLQCACGFEALCINGEKRDCEFGWVRRQPLMHAHTYITLWKRCSTLTCVYVFSKYMSIWCFKK